MSPFQEGYDNDLFAHAENSAPNPKKHDPQLAVPEVAREEVDQRNIPLTAEQIAALPADLKAFYDRVGYPGSKSLEKYYERLDSFNQ